ncbi:DUF6903 family protein [Candidatus Pelagibacter sp.]|uniref:DUF6903 family protein n=1 Tax=Candidatus Pelagibacter sp. TaxID=2024849 RepID=UPI003F8486CD
MSSTTIRCHYFKFVNFNIALVGLFIVVVTIIFISNKQINYENLIIALVGLLMMLFNNILIR